MALRLDVWMCGSIARAGPRRPLRLELSDTQVYEPQIRAHLGHDATPFRYRYPVVRPQFAVLHATAGSLLLYSCGFRPSSSTLNLNPRFAPRQRDDVDDSPEPDPTEPTRFCLSKKIQRIIPTLF